MLIPLPVLESVLAGTDLPFLCDAARANLRCRVHWVRYGTILGTVSKTRTSLRRVTRDRYIYASAPRPTLVRPQRFILRTVAGG